MRRDRKKRRISNLVRCSNIYFYYQTHIWWHGNAWPPYSLSRVRCFVENLWSNFHVLSRYNPITWHKMYCLRLSIQSNCELVSTLLFLSLNLLNKWNSSSHTDIDRFHVKMSHLAINLLPICRDNGFSKANKIHVYQLILFANELKHNKSQIIYNRFFSGFCVSAWSAACFCECSNTDGKKCNNLEFKLVFKVLNDSYMKC